MNRDRDVKESKNGTQVELKYCERCGALVIRESGSEQVYCNDCVPEIGELPGPGRRGKGARVPEDALLEEDSEFETYNFDALEFEAEGGTV